MFAPFGDEYLQLSPATLALPAPVVQVASSNSTQYALLADGTVYAWGWGDDGQLGDDAATNWQGAPVRVQFPRGVKIAFLSTDVMPFNTGLAVDTKGDAWGWGDNSYGQLCLGNRTEQLAPVEVPLHDVTALAGAGAHALYDSEGTVYSCGANGYGDLGDANFRPITTTPVEVSGLAGKDVRELVASWGDSGALLADGTYLDWGYDAAGQLGDGALGVNSDVPVTVALPLPVDQVAQGGSYSGDGQTLVMLSNGSLRSWGNDSFGQLGDGKTTNEASPVTFSSQPGVKYWRLATGGGTSYALSTTGDLYSWGYNGNGEIGDGKTATQLTPVMVASGMSFISATADDAVTS